MTKETVSFALFFMLTGGSKQTRKKQLMKKNKVIIWGLGSVGRYAVKMILQKKTLELAGAVDIDPDKVGKDAGELFGFENAGVTVSSDIDEVLKTEADVVLIYLPNMRDKGDMRPTGFTPNAENICRALRAGKNVITTLPVYHMKKTAPKLYEMVNNCALENKVTYTQQGIFPGLFNPYLPIVIASMTGRTDKVIVTGGQDDSYNTSPWVAVFGYGKNPEDFNGALIKDTITSYYGPAVMEIAERTGIEYDEYEEEHRMFTAETEMNPPCGKVMPGTISAHEFVMRCMKDGEEVTGFHFIHKVCDDLQPVPAMFDGYKIVGEPNLEVVIKGMIPAEEPFASSTAPGVNLIPLVAEAQPGFIDALDLPASRPVL